MQMRRVALAIFSEASPENEQERKRTLHHQLTEKSSVKLSKVLLMFITLKF